MNISFSILFLSVIIVAVLYRKHKILAFISLLSVFADAFRINIGPSLLLINVVGFFVIPYVVMFYYNKQLQRFTKQIRKVLKPLWFNYLYLVLLGAVFGFLFPWTDNSLHRAWTQESEGRTIITLVRYLNEFFIAIYFFWLIATNKISLKFVVTSIGWITFFSFNIALIEYFFGPIFRGILLSSTNILTDRFIGLNGEPKILGRNSALAYIIILLYYLKIERKRKLLFFVIINGVSVILSISASAYILFALFNLYLILEIKSLKLFPILSVFIIASFIIFENNTFFQDSTRGKIEKALFGDNSRIYSSVNTFEKAFISRFDIFDHLALLFLFDNPEYILTGTGPNLISIPASKYISYFKEYSSYSEIGGIDSVPNVMFNNVLASSGLLGLILYFIFFRNLFRFSKYDKTGFSKNLVVITLIFNMVYFSVVLLFLTGIIVGYVSSSRKEGQIT